MFGRRKGFAFRFRAEFSKDRLQGADALAELITVVIDDLLKLADKSGGFWIIYGRQQHRLVQRIPRDRPHWRT